MLQDKIKSDVSHPAVLHASFHSDLPNCGNVATVGVLYQTSSCSHTSKGKKMSKKKKSAFFSPHKA